MEKKIKEKLLAVTGEHDIKILFACESGSRAWGFPAMDSDYDVRFIYVLKSEDYLSVFGTKEDIQFPIYDDLDIYGWDLRKVLRLLYKSNVTPFEWIQSPIVYACDPDFVYSFKNLLPYFYCARNHMHHYLGVVNGRLEQLHDDKMSLKSFFYILRSLLSAKWSLEYGHFAPMELGPLLTLLPDHLRNDVYGLKAVKSTVDESYFFELEDHFKSYFIEEYHDLYEKAKAFLKKKNSTERLNTYFLDILSSFK